MKTYITVLIFLSLTLAGCSSSTTSSRESPTTPPTPSTLNTSVPKPKTFESEECIPVSEELVDSIAQGINDSEITGRAAGHDAAEFKELTFIAIEFIPNGTNDPQIAVFATNDDDVSDRKLNGLIVAVDGFAKTFSDWGASLNINISISDKGARESKDCISLPGATLAEPKTAPVEFDESEFIRLSGENFDVFDETYDDGSTLTVMAMARAICDGNLATLKFNLGDKWDSSYQKFTIMVLCPEKLN